VVGQKMISTLILTSCGCRL